MVVAGSSWTVSYNEEIFPEVVCLEYWKCLFYGKPKENSMISSLAKRGLEK
jgi:hypothetical protein